jgi:hypothetical protein
MVYVALDKSDKRKTKEERHKPFALGISERSISGRWANEGNLSTGLNPVSVSLALLDQPSPSSTTEDDKPLVSVKILITVDCISWNVCHFHGRP